MRVVINSKDFNKKMNNALKYSQTFASASKSKENYINNKVANTSIEAFYEYLDVLARTNPAMLHHVYEWGQTGNPDGRLYELKSKLTKGSAVISADFLDSSSTPEGSDDVFWNKAEVMEEGIPVTIQEVEAQALFFIVDGEEFFRLGPITIQNPGGQATRGSFVRNFEEFYNVYFESIFLKSINFNKHFQNPQAYAALFSSAVNGNPIGAGEAAAEQWFATSPGDEYV